MERKRVAFGRRRDWRWKCREWFPYRLKMLDRRVQGWTIENLSEAAESKLKDLDEAYEKNMSDENSHFWGRDGRWPVPCYPARHAAVKRIQKVQNVLKEIQAGTFQPTHTIAIDGDGRWLMDTVEVFCP